MKIIGLEGCPKCKEIKTLYPNATYIEIPRLSLGFGDTIAKITCFFGIRPCLKCRLRQNILNNIIPYTWRVKKINQTILDAKKFAYKQGAKEFPILVDDNVSKIIRKE
jgi:hypothetical protein